MQQQKLLVSDGTQENRGCIAQNIVIKASKCLLPLVTD